MAREMETLDDLWSIEDRISSDLSKVVGGDVMACIYVGDVDQVRPIQQDFTSLETYCDVEELVFDKYNESPDIFEVVESNGKANRWRSQSLRSNCRVTNQPDWGDVYISIKGSKTVTPESLLQYIVSMRKENHFHEEICECIYIRLYELLQPEALFVGCLYTRRGGIDINPARASNNAVLYTYANNLTGVYPCLKTPRQ
jgi:7-cyano-7-deazaguanine reductase